MLDIKIIFSFNPYAIERTMFGFPDESFYYPKGFFKHIKK